MMSSIWQNLAKHICPLLLWCFWLAAVFQPQCSIVPSQKTTTKSVQKPLLFSTEEDDSVICFCFWTKIICLLCDLAGPFKWAERYNGACLSHHYRTAQAEVQTQLRQTRITEPNGDLANKQPSWCFSTRSYQQACSRSVSGVLFHITKVFEEV